MNNTYKITKRFYDDHISRGCGETGKVVKETKQHYWVDLDKEAYDDLFTDADYYAGHLGTGFIDPDYNGLCLSARATVKALKHQWEV